MPENIITIGGVNAFEKGGTVYLNLEAVARGLGFTRVAASGNEVVRWERVDSYLADMGVPASGHDAYIPENIFYRLAMKARNETAENFQALVADEIIPTIRRTGSYQAKPMTTLEMLAAQAQAMVEQERRMAQLEARSAEQEQKIEKAVSVFSLPTVEVEGWRNEMNSHIHAVCASYGLSHSVFRGETYRQLEDRAGVCLSSRVKRKQERMRKAGAKYSERNAITKLHVISEDAKLRGLYESIVRQCESQLFVNGRLGA